MSVSKKLVIVITALVMAMSMALFGCSSGNTDTSTTDNSGTTTDTSSSASTSTTSNDQYTLIKDGTLTVGSDCDYPPFISLNGDQPQGFEYDLMQAIADDMGLTLEYLPPQNFDTLLTSVAGGVKMDLAVSSITITDDREQTVDFCTPYFDSNQACVVMNDSTYTAAADLAGKTVGAQSGTTGEEWANEHLDGITMKPFNQTSEGLIALQAGQIEAMFFDAPIAEYQIANNYPNMKILEVIPTGEQYGFAVSKDNPGLKDAVDASLQHLVDNGTYAKIFKQYFPNLEPSIG